MAVQTWYVDQELVSVGVNRMFYNLAPGAATAEATSGTGWTVGKIAINNYSELSNGTERATGTFTTTIVPTATAPTSDETFSPAVLSPPPLIVSSDSIATLYPYNGYFPAGNWTFAFPVIAVTAGGVQDGRITLRVFKGARAVGDTTWTGVTELTAALQSGSTVTNLATAASQTSTVTWTAPAFFLNNEFLIIKMAWQITGAGNANGQDVLLRFGSTATMVSTNFRARQYNIT